MRKQTYSSRDLIHHALSMNKGKRHLLFLLSQRYSNISWLVYIFESLDLPLEETYIFEQGSNFPLNIHEERKEMETNFFLFSKAYEIILFTVSTIQNVLSFISEECRTGFQHGIPVMLYV